MKGIDRREFMKTGARNLAAVALGSAIDIPQIFRQTEVLAANQSLTLEITEVLHQMVDKTLVYSWAFTNPSLGPQPTIPGPVIYAIEGDQITITVRNRHNKAGAIHAFAITGTVPGTYLPGTETGPIAPNRQAQVSFTAPPAGTYMYLDPTNDPVSRVLGLHGMMIIRPATSTGAAVTPYGPSNITPNVQALFDDLGNTTHFPGLPWDPAREHIWILSQIDPTFNKLAQDNEPINPSDMVNNFLPRYYTMNGRSGYFSAHDPDIQLIGRAGEPRLIRCMNVGLAVHSNHVHANHAYRISYDGVVQNNVWWVDTWTTRGGDIYDMLYPMVMPPDIPLDTWNKLKNGTSQEGFDDNPMHGTNKGFPMWYPMHCHLEMSQTAAGGNYPQGMVTHIVFTGAVPGV